MWTVVVLQKEASAGSGRWTPLMHGLDEFAHANGTTPVFLFVFLIFFFFKSLSAQDIGGKTACLRSFLFTHIVLGSFGGGMKWKTYQSLDRCHHVAKSIGSVRPKHFEQFL